MKNNNKKILLIGKLSDIVRNLNECLIERFQVQLCSTELENVQAMIRIVKPQLVLISQIGMDETDNAILEWLSYNSEIPVLGITTSEKWMQCREYYQSEQFQALFRPVAKNELVRKCYEMLGEECTPKEAPLSLKKIMIVDDSALLLRSMKSMMEKHYDVCLAKSGEQALKMIPEEKPDLILLDYEMDGMDGKTTFETMKEDAAMKSIPVVFLTSMADRQTVYSVLRVKPDGYILKPPDEGRICETIQEILGGGEEQIVL